MSISDFLTLFSSRTNGFFWTSPPAPLLLGAALFSLSLSTLLACVWPNSHAEHSVPVRGLSRSGYKVWPLWVWLYCLIWCAAASLMLYRILTPSDCTPVIPRRDPQ